MFINRLLYYSILKIRDQKELSMWLPRRLLSFYILTLMVYRIVAVNTLTLVLVYLLALLFIANSLDLQNFIVFLPFIRSPIAKLGNLKDLGLDSLARNIQITTNDGNTLKGWHLFDNLNEMASCIDKSDTCLDQLLAGSERIIIYFHGNAFSRGLPIRIKKMRKLSSLFNAHIIVFDYSGFGDSTGYPSEAAALNDAMAMLKFVNDSVVNHNPSASGWYTSSKSLSVQQPHLYFYGHSLGTGISTALLHHLHSNSESNNHPISGLIMDSPFTSIPDVVGDHILVKFFPRLSAYVKKLFHVRFPSLERINEIGKVPLLIMHGAKDKTIPVEHGRQLAAKASSGSSASADGVSNSAEKVMQCDASQESDCAVATSSRLVKYWEIPGAHHNGVFLSKGWEDTIHDFITKAEKVIVID